MRLEGVRVLLGLSFFEPRVVVLTGAPPVPAGETCGGAVYLEVSTECLRVSLVEVLSLQYDLITDLLDSDMFKVYVDMLKCDKQRVKGGQPVKFGYLPMMDVVTLAKGIWIRKD